MPFPAAQTQTQRSASYNASSSQGNGIPARTSYPSSTAAYNPNNGGGQYGSSNGGNYGGYGNGASSSNNGYGNGMGGISSHDTDNKYAKKSKRKWSDGPGGLPVFIGAVVLFVYAVLMTGLYFSNSGQTKTLLSRLKLDDTVSIINKVESLERKLEHSEATRRNAANMARDKVTGEINRLERSNKLATEQVDELKNLHLPQAHSTIEKHSRREKAFMNQVGWLMDRTRRESKRMVLERFGPGPHKVQVTFAVPAVDPNDEKKRFSFVIEFAPLEKVPHAIHLFLEQVDHGLLEGTHFYLNGPHIVQAGPQPDWTVGDGGDENDDAFHGSTGEKEKISGNALQTIKKYERQAARNKVIVYDDDEYESSYSAEDYFEEDTRTKKFQDLGLDQLAFPDYHPEYPHVPWTVGFTGRPGGPDWYINKVDNTEVHGPGGQPQHDLEEQGDSCFGTISLEGEGRSALAGNIYSSDVYADSTEWHHFISSPIEIVHATILTKNPILDRHIHLDHLTSQHKVYDARRKQNTNNENGEGLPKSEREPDRMPLHDDIHRGRVHMHDAADA